MILFWRYSEGEKEKWLELAEERTHELEIARRMNLASGPELTITLCIIDMGYRPNAHNDCTAIYIGLQDTHFAFEAYTK